MVAPVARAHRQASDRAEVFIRAHCIGEGNGEMTDIARKSLDDLDRELLRDLSGREARIADAATRLAYGRAGDWLSDKQAKASQFPGGDLDHAKGRSAAYQNAAQEIYGWAIAHGEE